MAQNGKLTNHYNGFAIPLQPEEGHYEPVAVASTMNEAKELAESDLRDRMRRLELGEDAGLCPALYKVWARGIDGDYRLAYEIADLLK